MEDIIGVVVCLVVIGIGLLIYFIPSFVAVENKHPNQDAIKVLNLLLGWSILGWVIALVWACSKPNAPAASQPVPSSIEDRLRKLANLNVNGIIDAQEYERQKKRIIEEI